MVVMFSLALYHRYHAVEVCTNIQLSLFPTHTIPSQLNSLIFGTDIKDLTRYSSIVRHPVYLEAALDNIFYTLGPACIFQYEGHQILAVLI